MRGHRDPARAALLACVVSGAFYGLVAASLPFYDKGEPREALAVQAILRGEGAILTRPDGQHVQSKPPLFHWMASLAAVSLGRAGEFAMRLPSVVLAALGVALTVFVAARERGVAAGLLSAVVLASSFEWLRAGTQSRVDMALTFFVVSAVWAWRRGTVEPGRTWSVRAGYLAVAAGVLTKGPVGLVLPGLVLTADALWRRAPRSLLRLLDAPGIAGMLIVCVGWYVLAWTRGGSDFASRHLVHENLQRFVGWGAVAHRHPAPYYVAALAGAFMPWTFALPLAAGRIWRRPHPGDAFLIVWIVTVVAFFSLAAGKRSTYLLPIFPPLAILTGTAIAGATERPLGPWPRVLLRTTGVTLLGVAGACALDLGAPLVALLEPLIQGSDRARLPAVLAVVHEQRSTIAATLAVGAAALFVVSSPRGGPAPRLAALATIALTFAAGLTAFGTFPVARRLTTRPFAERVVAHLRPGDRLCSCGDLDRTLRFYLGRPIPQCGTQAAERVAWRSSAIEADTTDTHGGPRRYRVRPLRSGARAAAPPCATHRYRGSALGPARAL